MSAILKNTGTPTTVKKELTFTEKEVRKYRKKARQAEEKFKETNDTSWLTLRDKHNDTVLELLRNQVTNVNNKKKKKQKKQNTKKTDDQLFNEAMRQNRIEKAERMKEAEEKQKKKDELSKRRSELKEMIREKREETAKMIQDKIDQQKEFDAAEKEFREDFIKDYLEKYPDKNQSEAQKESVKEYKKMIAHINFKNNVIQHLVQQGMTLEEATSEFNKMIGRAIKEKNAEEDEGPTITEM